MHELSITRNIVAIALQQSGDRPVERVRLAIGRLTAVMPDALRFCFDVVSRDTMAAGARLDIDMIDGEAECGDCGRRFAMPVTGARCSCGSPRYRLLAGEELKIVELELGRA